jgi:hypothetical protein
VSTGTDVCRNKRLLILPVLGAIGLLLAACDIGITGADGSAPGPAAGGTEPLCGGYYDLYTAETGASIGVNGAHNYQPPDGGTDNQAFTTQAFNNFNSGHGVGAGSYYFLSGPAWAPSGMSAYNWGYYQAAYAVSDYNQALIANGHSFSFLYIWGDIEISPGTTDYGWNPSPNPVQLTANQQVWQGFYQTLQSVGVNVGIYASPGDWSNLMNENVAQVEWTSQADYGPATPCPSATFSGGPGGYAAQFFGGQTASSITALEWQWAQGTNSPGDFDQFDLTHYNTSFGINLQP